MRSQKNKQKRNKFQNSAGTCVEYNYIICTAGFDHDRRIWNDDNDNSQQSCAKKINNNN